MVEIFEAENEQDVATKEVGSKVKEMASKLGSSSGMARRFQLPGRSTNRVPGL